MSEVKLFSITTEIKDDPAVFTASLDLLEEQTNHKFEFAVIESSDNLIGRHPFSDKQDVTQF